MIKIYSIAIAITLLASSSTVSANNKAEEKIVEPSAAMKRYQEVWQSKNPYDNEFYTSFRYQPLKGLEMEEGVSRRDASQILKADGVYYVYYTKVVMPNNQPPVGYQKADENTPANTWDLADIFYATSNDGKTWKEQGLAVPRGPKGEFDDRSVFTPGVLEWQGKYYLYYQAVKWPYNQRTKNVIGMSWADSPAGPWHRHPEPILTPGKSGIWKGDKPIRSQIEKEGDFDSLKVHDPFLLVFNDKIHLYYKAHPMGLSGKLKLTYPDFSGGLATADSPFGPFVKHPQNPVLNSGHEVVLWPYKSGVAALVTANGPEKNTIQWSPDGVNFEIKSHVVLPPDAAGPYVPDAYTNTKDGQGITWGISHVAQRKNQPWPHLIRFDTDLTGHKTRKLKRENIRFTKEALFNSDKR
ncbi:family 43 glycosylhydrolase [Thalassotalea sp. SU-HH00458]|uniref:glycoside hydrolase family 117 protein n=1 Tax=Thalassotalea sp. SU-HH00458 TaxID=3127657 RepID=UPI0031047A68